MIYRPELSEIILENVAILVATLDEGEIVWVNPALEAMFASTIRGQMIGMNVDDLVPQHLRDDHFRHREEYRKKPMVRAMGARLEVEGCRLSGEPFPARITLIPAIMAGQPMVVTMIFDMSDPTAPH